MQRYASVGRIRSIDMVKLELDRGSDDLTDWAELPSA